MLLAVQQGRHRCVLMRSDRPVVPRPLPSQIPRKRQDLQSPDLVEVRHFHDNRTGALLRDCATLNTICRAAVRAACVCPWGSVAVARQISSCRSS